MTQTELLITAELKRNQVSASASITHVDGAYLVGGIGKHGQDFEVHVKEGEQPHFIKLQIQSAVRAA